MRTLKFCLPVFLLFSVLAWADQPSPPPDPQRAAPDLTLSIEKLFGAYTYWQQTEEGYECGFIEFAVDHTWTMVIHIDADRDRHADSFLVDRGRYAVGRRANGTFGFWLEGENLARVFLAEVRIIGGGVHSFTALGRSFTRRSGDMPYFVMDHNAVELAGDLRIVSEPAGALVFINDNQVVGNTPLVVQKLRAGVSLRIRLVLPDYRAREQVITLAANESREIRFHLFRGDAGLRVTSLPQVKVKLDGEWIGATPVEVEELAAGPHVLELVNQVLGIDQREEFEVAAGETFERDYQFTGLLVIDVGRRCKIYRRDRQVGATPFREQVPVGRHVLVLVDEAGKRKRISVEVPYGGEVRVEKLFVDLPDAD